MKDCTCNGHYYKLYTPQKLGWEHSERTYKETQNRHPHFALKRQHYQAAPQTRVYFDNNIRSSWQYGVGPDLAC